MQFEGKRCKVELYNCNLWSNSTCGIRACWGPKVTRKPGEDAPSLRYGFRVELRPPHEWFHWQLKYYGIAKGGYAIYKRRFHSFRQWPVGIRIWGMKHFIPGAVVLVVLLALIWWIHLSPGAKRCFAAGGTTYDIPFGTCRKVTVEIVKP